ncbi:MAG: helix-turn-helix transcriptional regulator [Chloroflexi bacterium]|nr:helix-turn-helix transcriptional regulator [Chloroflexota bacterium]
MTPRELVTLLPRYESRSAVYRILAGKSTDPRLSTVLAICEVLGVSPTELAQLAGLYPRVERRSASWDLRLRQAFGTIQALDPEVKGLAITLVEATVDVLDRWRRSRP